MCLSCWGAARVIEKVKQRSSIIWKEGWNQEEEWLTKEEACESDTRTLEEIINEELVKKIN